jgi:hypothetical protein
MTLLSVYRMADAQSFSMASSNVCVKHSTVLNRLLLYDGISVLVSLAGVGINCPQPLQWQFKLTS